MPEQQIPYSTEVFTGIRPTGNLTVANYIGAVEPLIGLQTEGKSPLVFVADLHGLTDREPGEIVSYTHAVVADYLALGVDPNRAKIFIQSELFPMIGELSLILSRHTSLAELMRLPTLKDKLKGAKPETAKALLGIYPVMMSADILLQQADIVPVGEDQMPHIEVTRRLARRFNSDYGDTFHIPQAHTIAPVRILSLRGEGKMSKTNPEGAIFLTDDPDVAAKKVQKATTAFAGERTDSLDSLVVLVKGLCVDEHDLQIVDDFIARHMQKEQIMGAFKKEAARIVREFLVAFQSRRIAIREDDVHDILLEGKTIAEKNARDTLQAVHKSLGI